MDRPREVSTMWGVAIRATCKRFGFSSYRLGLVQALGKILERGRMLTSKFFKVCGLPWFAILKGKIKEMGKITQSLMRVC